MRTSGNAVLITGGATGIGFALAKAFIDSGNEVLICGRREDKLKQAKEKLPDVNILSCDVSKDSERKRLHEWVNSNFKRMNILVNNAGIQRTIDFKKGIEELLKSDDEIDINLKAQVHLAVRFIPILAKHDEAAIVNVSSGLGFVPLAMFPVYSATKAAIHSFTMSLRHQLRESKIKVFEIVPPTVYDTELKGKPLERTEWMASAAEVADAAIKGLESDEYEIAVGASERWVRSSRDDIDKIFKDINH